MLLTNLILLLALVVMVGIAIWLFRDGEGVGPTPYIRPFDNDGAAVADGESTTDAPPQQPQTQVRVQSAADADRHASDQGHHG